MLKFTTKLSALILLLVFSFTLSAQEDPSAASLYNDGLGKMKEKDYAGAFPLFEEAIANADTTSDMGKKVTDLASRNGTACAYRLGSMERKAKKYAEALVYFDKGIEMNSEYFGNYLGRAQALEDIEGSESEAVLAYIVAGDQAMATSNNKDKAPQLYRKAQNFSAVAYIKDDNFEEAIKLADVYMEARPDGNDAYIAAYYKAAAFNKMEKDADALPAIQVAVAALPEDEDGDKYHLLHGLVQQALGNNEDAIAAYAKVTGTENADYKAAAQSRIDALKQ
jgi:tetratricopeptide (TPR) repeat protein